MGSQDELGSFTRLERRLAQRPSLKNKLRGGDGDGKIEALREHRSTIASEVASKRKEGKGSAQDASRKEGGAREKGGDKRGWLRRTKKPPQEGMQHLGEKSESIIDNIPEETLSGKKGGGVC